MGLRENSVCYDGIEKGYREFSRDVTAALLVF